jgi:L-alanine-DL-glutamate epimerase-like enolase superfamily enzyme
MTQDEIVARNVFKVRLFIDAWEAVDPDVAMACLSDDIIYINQPLAPSVDQDQQRGTCYEARTVSTESPRQDHRQRNR